ncbi:MAG TPA: PqqD family protein [Chloroflexota bacterium]|jgi:hypothetical protein|nr:PqqD family protein [Chloroflexota bacterium]
MAISRRQFVINESVVYAELEGEAVLLNVETGVYFGLNGIATDIWKLFERGASPEEIVHQLVEEYDVEPAVVQEDLDRFLDSLRSHGLVRDSDYP